ncbi:four-carbon acid sugar kinase family protein [Cryptosporangium sp. NPDC048952]|uniref:four-carbon acid sugar kinase family protein n=1 Tax=Cryptosporangium sp. NPDC048952 TaxID=3363961 RepID=UPI0037201ECE
MSSGRVLVLADDLTSAAEVGGMLARRGEPALVTTRPDAPIVSAAAERVCITTASRAMSAEDARGTLDRCVKTVSGKPGLVFKTMDSSLRGNWAAELDATMRGLGRHTALVAPAFPAENRITQGGIQYADGVPVDLGPAGFDPCTPVSISRVSEHLRAAGLHATELRRPTLDNGEALRNWLAARAYAPELAAVIVDAEDAADLELIVRSGAPERLVWCGSPGLAAALLADAPLAPPPVSAAALAVVGSLHPVSRGQVEHAHAHGIPVIEIAADASPSATALAVEGRLRTARRAILCTPMSTLMDAPDAHAAAVVREVVLRTEDLALVLTGGDTASAVLAGLDADVLHVVGQWAPGIPVGRLDGVRTLPLATKAGGFGRPDTLVSLLTQLTRGASS